jgi:hypothetical protein
MRASRAPQFEPRVEALYNCKIGTRFFRIARRHAVEDLGRTTLREWNTELRDFRSQTALVPPEKDVFSVAKGITRSKESGCDYVVRRPTLVIKEDIAANVYHALCDHINLWLSAQVAGLGPRNTGGVVSGPEVLTEGALAPQVLYWTYMNRRSETVVKRLFSSPFHALVGTISDRGPKHLGGFYHKRLCFQRLIFSVNPRSVGTFYYNLRRHTPCRAGAGSLVQTFGADALRRVALPFWASVGAELRDRAGLPEWKADWAAMVGSDPATLNSREHLSRKEARMHPAMLPYADSPWLVRIGMLSRGGGTGPTSGTRHIVNEEALVALIRAPPSGSPLEDATLDVVHFNHTIPIEAQVARSARFDVLVSMHGAGLVHMLWLPPWAAVFEIYACGDRCYADLAKVAGFPYFTLEHDSVRPQVPSATKVPKRQKTNPKFWDYQVDPQSFLRQLERAVIHARDHPARAAARAHQAAEIGKEGRKGAVESEL